MPKTPDEIKKGLGFCSRATCGEKDIECPYECGNSNCMTHLTCDALALIQQLESKLECSQMTIDGLTATLLKCDTIIQQLEAERDAAVAGLKSNCTCPECKYFSDDIQDPCRGCKPNASKFEWRGIQKEATP